jgi:hypothetical protein
MANQAKGWGRWTILPNDADATALDNRQEHGCPRPHCPQRNQEIIDSPCRRL